jgi:hypothetical protein
VHAWWANAWWVTCDGETRGEIEVGALLELDVPSPDIWQARTLGFRFRFRFSEKRVARRTGQG